MPQSKSVKFKTRIQSNGKTAAGIIVSAEKVAELGQGKRVPVIVSLNGYSYRNTIAVMGGQYCIGVSSDVRKDSGLKPNDSVDVILTVDDKPREVKIPKELKNIFQKHPATKTFFDSLSYSNKLRFALQIETAKTPETLKKRVEKVTLHLKSKTKI